MPPPATDQAWPPASPADLAASLLASLQHVTSSARLLLIGCFQCESLRAGCWGRRQEEQDGAWFDCDKLQVEHPYCYVNPVALSEGASAAALQFPPQPSPTPQRQRAPSPRPQASHHSGPVKAPPQRSPGSALAPRGLSTHTSTPPRKRHKKTSINGDVNSTVVVRGSLREDGRVQNQGDFGTDAPRTESVTLKAGAARYQRNRGGRGTLVESFAAKLEADLRKLDYDRQRAEGELVEVAPAEDGSDSPQEYLCSESQGDAEFLTGNTSVSSYHYEDFDGRPRLEEDVWKPSELEDVFECYNMAAFYSYGTTFPVGEKFAAKVRGEKFEEVFPVSPHNNNNNTIKVFKPASESESSLPLPVDDKDEASKENVRDTSSAKENRTVSEDQLKQFISVCVPADSIADVNGCCLTSQAHHGDNEENVCYGEKSFNKLLIFNLVKSVMSECVSQYPRSLSLCVSYPVHLVQNKVIKVLTEEDKGKENLCGMQVFRSPLHHTQRGRLLARRRVESVAADEARAEDGQWQDFKKEEQEMKDAISTEVLHDLISDTAELFNSLLAKKLVTITEGECNGRLGGNTDPRAALK